MNATSKTPIHTEHCLETNMTAYVFENSNGTYNVSVKDNDSGEFLTSVTCGIKTLENAVKKAKQIFIDMSEDEDEAPSNEIIKNSLSEMEL